MEHSLFGEADKPHILVIDDDDRIRSLLSRYLREHHFVVSTAKDAADAKAVLKLALYDALVVDVMMPGQTGYEFTRELRASSDIPILLLTALGEVDNRIEGLESGADDYLPKPFEPKELVLRLKSILKRHEPVNREIGELKIGRWAYDPENAELSNDTQTIRLTAVEARLLETLARHMGKILSRDELARPVILMEMTGRSMCK